MRTLKVIGVTIVMFWVFVSGPIQAFEFEDVTPEEAGFSSEKLSKRILSRVRKYVCRSWRKF